MNFCYKYQTYFVIFLFIHLLALFYAQSVIKNHVAHTPSALMVSLVQQTISNHIRPKAYKPQKMITPITQKKSQISEVLAEPSTVSNPLLVQGIKNEYLQELRSAIEKNKVYPTLSKRLRQTGTVEVAFRVTADGHLINIHLKKASSFERLNESALEAVKKVSHFKPIPHELGLDHIETSVPIRFSVL